jgi:ribonuclease HI
MEEAIYDASFDGSTRHEDQRSTIGFVIYTAQKNILCRSYRPVDFGTSVEVEYKALIELLKTAIGLNVKCIHIKGDCKIIFDKLNSDYGFDSLPLSELHKKCVELLTHFDYYKLTWVPRGCNKTANRLSRKSLNPK